MVKTTINDQVGWWGVYEKGYLGVSFFTWVDVCWGNGLWEVGKMDTSGNRDCQWASKNGYSNSIRVGYDRAEQIREGVSGDGLEGNFWEERLPPCIQSQLKCLHGGSVHNLFWQFVWTARKLNACWRRRVLHRCWWILKVWPRSLMRVGEQKLRHMESWEGRALFCTCRLGHHGFFYGLGKRATAVGGLSHMGHGAAPLQTSPQVFQHFLAPGNPGREWGRMLVLHIQDAGE